MSSLSHDAAVAARSLIAGRQNVTPRRLVEPGPTDVDLHALLEAAAAAPDHGQIAPWRFIRIVPQARAALGEAFRRALLERDPAADDAAQRDAVDKAFRGPCLLLAVVDFSPHPKGIPPLERTLSLGCAIQNMLLLAQAMGFASGLSSGQALACESFRATFGLTADEQAVCFVSFGTPSLVKPLRPRPEPSSLLSDFLPDA